MEKDQNSNIKEDEENINLSEKDKNSNIKEDEENINLSEKDKTEQTLEKNNTSPDEKILELEDKLARTFAEMENQRRRFEKEKDDAFEYGGFSFARESLNLIDNLERAKKSLEEDVALKGTEALKKSLENFEIIQKDLISIFKKNNVEQIDAINKKLDPNFHQAMIEIDDDNKEPGTIIQEIQKGFIMKDRLLRPSLVGVSKKSPTKNESEDKKSQENQENISSK